MKALADDPIDVTQKLKFVLRQVENISEKEGNASYQYFFHFQKCLQKPPSSGSLIVGIVLNFVSTNQQNFRISQIEKICRRQNKHG